MIHNFGSKQQNKIKFILPNYLENTIKACLIDFKAISARFIARKLFSHHVVCSDVYTCILVCCGYMECTLALILIPSKTNQFIHLQVQNDLSQYNSGIIDNH